MARHAGPFGPTGPLTGPIRIDPLRGARPTWRIDRGDAPIYLEVVAALGSPDGTVPPGAVIVGEVVNR